MRYFFLCVCTGIFWSLSLPAQQFFTKASSRHEQIFLHATEKARPGVVVIFAVIDPPSHDWKRFGEGFFSPVFHETSSMGSEYSQGSGFIISEDGYIVTNYHVIGESTNISVQLLGGQEYPAQVIGKDAASDIALIKIDATGLHKVSFANSSQVEVGEWVLAIGSPFGLHASVSTGIVSADSRSYPGGLLVQEFFQTDAAINPGNSGGPLVNLDGKVIGMNTMAALPGGGSIGIGFAIPSNLIQEVVEDLINNRKPVHGHLGLLLFQIDKQSAAAFGIGKGESILVVSVNPESSAGKAGILPGDVILELQNTRMRQTGEFRTAIAFSKPGDELSIAVQREDKRLVFTVTVEGQPELSPIEIKIKEEKGLKLQPTILSKEGNDIKKGLLVEEIDTTAAAYKAGLRPGNIIFSANGKAISTIDGFAEELYKKSLFPFVILRVFDSKTSHYIFLHR